MSLEPIIAHWTHCFHITAFVNVPYIRQFGTLFPARMLFQRTGRCDLLSHRRVFDVRLQSQSQEILIRNQTPLDPNTIALSSGESLEDYVAYLNSHVFFWPGTASGPTPDGVRMLRNAGVKSVFIRIPTRSLMEANDCSLVHLSTCNTGASWIVAGSEKCKRGRGVFQHVGSFTDPVERIEEISFRCAVSLPDNSECSEGGGEHWQSLFGPTLDQQRADSENLGGVPLQDAPRVLDWPSNGDPW